MNEQDSTNIHTGGGDYAGRDIDKRQIINIFLAGQGTSGLSLEEARTLLTSLIGDPALQRLTLLRALLHNHTGFMHDRLASFVGRMEELAEVQRRVAELLPTGGYVTITAQAGQGKSCLIAKLVELALYKRCGVDAPQGIGLLAQQAGPAALAYHFIPFSPGPDHQVGLLRNLMARLILKYDLPEIYVATDSRPALRDYFVRVLEEVVAHGGQEVIYIDGLDQIEEDASGVRDLSFLPTKPPAGIVFVLGSRPNDTLQPLELRKPHHQYWLPPLSRADFNLVLQHRKIALETHLADRFYTVMEANALYLDLVARELAEAGALSPEQIIIRIADNPENLFSLAIERLKRPTLEWRILVKPILGVLLVAQEPLTATSIRIIIGQDDEAVRGALVRLGGLLARDGQGRYTLFHLKLRDFLHEDPQRQDKGHVFAVDEEQDYHQRLAGWCEQSSLATIWQNALHDAVEQTRRCYARRHFITHLCRAQSWPRLCEVLDEGKYGKAKLQRDPSTRDFVLDLDTVRQAVVVAINGDFEKGVAWLPNLWKYSLLRCSLSNQVDNHPDRLIELLARLDREQEAIGLTELLTNIERKIKNMARIGSIISKKGQYSEAKRLFTLTRLISMTIKLEEPNSEVLMDIEASLIIMRELSLNEKHDDAVLLGYEILMTSKQFLDEYLFDVVKKEISIVLGRAGKFSESKEMINQIMNIKMRNQAIEDFIELMAAIGKFSELLLAFENITDYQLREYIKVYLPAAFTQLTTLNADNNINSQIKRDGMQFNDILEAKNMALKIENNEQQSRAMIYLSSALLQNNQFNEAYITYSMATVAAMRIEDQSMRIEVLCDIVIIMAKYARFSENRGILSTIRNDVFQIKDKKKRISSVFKFIVAASRSEHMDDVNKAVNIVKETAQSLSKLESRNDILIDLASILEQENRTSEADEIVNIVIKSIRQITRSEVQLHIFEKISTILIQNKQLMEALQVSRYIIDKKTQGRIVAKITSIMTNSGKIAESVTIAQEIQDKYWSSQVYKNIIIKLLQDGLVLEAIETTKHIQDIKLQSYIRRSLSRIMISKKQIPESIEIIRSIQDNLEKSHALIDVIRFFMKNGQFAKALDISNEANDVLKQIPDVVIRNKINREISLALSTKRQLEPPLEIVGINQMIIEDILKTSIYSDDNNSTFENKNDKIIYVDFRNSGIMEEYITQMINQRRFKEAIDEFQKIIKTSKHTTSINSIINTIMNVASMLAEFQQWDCVLSVISNAFILAQENAQCNDILQHLATFLKDFPHVPTVLTILQEQWGHMTHRDNLYTILPAATPLFIAEPMLLPQILEGEKWVQEQLKW